MTKHPPTRFQKVAKRLFGVRSFKGEDAAVIRERFRLVTGLVRDVIDGRLSESTARRLSVEIADRLKRGGPLSPGPSVSPRRIRRVLLAAFGRDHKLFRQELRNRHVGRTRRF